MLASLMLKPSVLPNRSAAPFSSSDPMSAALPVLQVITCRALIRSDVPIASAMAYGFWSNATLTVLPEYNGISSVMGLVSASMIGNAWSGFQRRVILYLPSATGSQGSNLTLTRLDFALSRAHSRAAGRSFSSCSTNSSPIMQVNEHLPNLLGEKMD